MCTVITRSTPGAGTAILAVRDEFESRSFDDPDAWWPDQPHVVGGRDKKAGGSWCVSDVETGVTALVLNRREKPIGTPSRGVLPLLAVAHRQRWPEYLDHATMAGFTLVLVSGNSVSAWEWDGHRLGYTALVGGAHVITPAGIDAADPLTTRIAPLLTDRPWRALLDTEELSDAPDALFVRRQIDGRAYGTVFAQLIDASPGTLHITSTRTPWVGGWVERSWTAP